MTNFSVPASCAASFLPCQPVSNQASSSSATARACASASFSLCFSLCQHVPAPDSLKRQPRSAPACACPCGWLSNVCSLPQRMGRKKVRETGDCRHGWESPEPGGERTAGPGLGADHYPTPGPTKTARSLDPARPCGTAREKSTGTSTTGAIAVSTHDMWSSAGNPAAWAPMDKCRRRPEERPYGLRCRCIRST